MRTFIVMVSMLTFCVVGLAQTTWNVPGDFSSIKDAFNDASVVEGDTILVGPGTYYENISFLGKDVTLKSTDGPAATVIDGSQRIGKMNAIFLTHLTKGWSSYVPLSY